MIADNDDVVDVLTDDGDDGADIRFLVVAWLLLKFMPSPPPAAAAPEQQPKIWIHNSNNDIIPYSDKFLLCPDFLIVISLLQTSLDQVLILQFGLLFE